MSIALFIIAERDVEGLDTFVNGKALAHCQPAGAKDRSGRQSERHLETLAREAGVRPLMEFFSVSPDDVRALLEEENDEADNLDLPPEQYFPATDGLVTVRGLLHFLAAHPDAAADVDGLIDDLRQFEEVLTALDAAGVRWHLAVDF